MKKIMQVMVVSIALVAIVPLLAQGGSFSNSSLSGTYVFQVRGNSSAMVEIIGLALFSTPTPPGCSNDPANPIGPCNLFTTIRYAFPIPTPRWKMGTFTADGAGNIVSGDGTCGGADLVENHGVDLTTNPPGSTFTMVPLSGVITAITGTYTVNPDGSGTLTLNPFGTLGCVEGGTFSFELTGKGDVGVFGFSIPSIDGFQFPHEVTGMFMKK